MHRPSILIVLLSCVAASLFSSAVVMANPVLWRAGAEHFGELKVVPRAVLPRQDGAVLFGQAFPGASTVLRFAVDASGTRVWNRSGTSIDFELTRVLPLGAGYVAGGVSDTSGIATPALIAFDAEGEERWTWRLPSEPNATLLALRVLPDDDVVAAWKVWSGIYLARVDAAGNDVDVRLLSSHATIWAAGIMGDGRPYFCGSFGQPVFSTMGENGFMEEIYTDSLLIKPVDCAIDHTGSAYFVGGQALYDDAGLRILRAGVDGMFQWEHLASPAPSGPGHHSNRSLSTHPDGSALLAWRSPWPGGRHLAKFSTAGVYEWTYTMDPPVYAFPVQTVGLADRILMFGQLDAEIEPFTLELHQLALDGNPMSITRIESPSVVRNWVPTGFHSTGRTWVSFWSSDPHRAHVVGIPDGGDPDIDMSQGSAPLGSGTCDGCVARAPDGSVVLVSWTDADHGSAEERIKFHRIAHDGEFVVDRLLEVIRSTPSGEVSRPASPFVAAGVAGRAFIVVADPSERSQALLLGLDPVGSEEWRHPVPGRPTTMVSIGSDVVITGVLPSGSNARSYTQRVRDDGTVAWLVEHGDGCCRNHDTWDFDDSAGMVAAGDALWMWGSDYVYSPVDSRYRLAVRRYDANDGVSHGIEFGESCGTKMPGVALASGDLVVVTCERVGTFGSAQWQLVRLDASLSTMYSIPLERDVAAIAPAGDSVVVLTSSTFRPSVSLLDPSGTVRWERNIAPCPDWCDKQKVVVHGSEIVIARSWHEGWRGDVMLDRIDLEGTPVDSMLLDGLGHGPDLLKWLDVDTADRVAFAQETRSADARVVVELVTLASELPMFRSGFE